jgi:hypothetical protein
MQLSSNVANSPPSDYAIPLRVASELRECRRKLQRQLRSHLNYGMIRQQIRKFRATEDTIAARQLATYTFLVRNDKISHP